MGMLAFFPWLRIEKDATLGEFELVSFERGLRPSGAQSPQQRVIDSILAPFECAPDRSVNLATLVRLDGRDLTDDLSEDERDRLFVFSKLVAFGGLARNEFCGLLPCCNATDFTLLLQGFRQQADGTRITIRRRDRDEEIRVMEDAYRVREPLYASHSSLPTKLDVALIEALLSARGHQLWECLRDAVEAFVRANSDNPEIAPQSEVVDMVGAFERVLGVWGKDDLKKRFGDHFKPRSDIPLSNAPRIPPARRNGPSLRRLWITDLYDLRNPPAHGNQSVQGGCLWDRAEHLLLGAYAFPLLVKSLLSDAGRYCLTVGDQDAIDAFEWRARPKEQLLLRDGSGQCAWKSAHLEFLREQARQSLAKAVSAP